MVWCVVVGVYYDDILYDVGCMVCVCGFMYVVGVLVC